MIAATYDRLHSSTSYTTKRGMLEAQDLFPGTMLQVGLELPIKNTTELTKVGNGTYDTVIRKMANVYKHIGQDVLLRIGYEFEGSWNGYDKTAYINAFRRIVDLFNDEGVTNVAFLWNAASSSNISSLMQWYPGDAYVDWFSYNCWNTCTPNSAYVTEANSRSKPIIIGESSKQSSTTAWDSFAPGYFSSLRSNAAVKGFQYINWNWPVYPSGWSSWGNSVYTGNSTYVSMFDTELQNSVYIVRDSTYFNPVALYVSSARNGTKSEVDGKPYSKSLDESTAQSGYDYTVVTSGVTTQYGDGYGTYWKSTGPMIIDLTVPSGSSGYILYNDNSGNAYNFHIGSNQVLTGAKGYIKVKYNSTDISNGKVRIKADGGASTVMQTNYVGIQLIHSSPVAVPSGLQITAQSSSAVSLSWSSVSDAKRYNIYRNGKQIGTSVGTTFTDDSPEPGTNTYRIAASHVKKGEGNMSTSVSTDSGGTPAPTVLLEENFNSMTSGSSPSGWTVTTASGTSALVDNTPSSSNKSVKFTDTSSSNWAVMEKTFTSQTGMITVESSFMAPTFMEFGRVMVVKSGTTDAIQIYTTASGNLIYRDSANVSQTIQAISTNTWYNLKVVANPVTSTFDIYVNGSANPIVSGATFKTAVSSLDRVHFGTSTSNTGTLYIDDIKVTK